MISRDVTDFVIDGSVVADRFGLTVDHFRASKKCCIDRDHLRDSRRRGYGRDPADRRGVLLWRFVLKSVGSIVEEPQILGKTDNRKIKDVDA